MVPENVILRNWSSISSVTMWFIFLRIPGFTGFLIHTAIIKVTPWVTLIFRFRRYVYFSINKIFLKERHYLIIIKSSDYNDENVICYCMNDRQGDLSCIFVYENEIKCFFLADLPESLQQMIMNINFHRFSERELSGEADGDWLFINCIIYALTRQIEPLCHMSNFKSKLLNKFVNYREIKSLFGKLMFYHRIFIRFVLNVSRLKIVFSQFIKKIYLFQNWIFPQERSIV